MVNVMGLWYIKKNSNTSIPCCIQLISSLSSAVNLYFSEDEKILEARSLLTYHSHLLRQEEVPNSIQDAIKTDVMKLVPLARRLMQITLTLPVTSNEAAERCFQK